MALADMRKDYGLAGLTEKDLAKDPFRQFERWFQEAEAAKVTEPNAMVLSTIGRDNRPSSRTVLLKGFDGRGFVFYTNYDSRKARDLDFQPNAVAVFPWIAMERQVIVEGSVKKTSREESEVYFHSRPRASQLAAWASPQSVLIASRTVLDESYRTMEKKFADQEIPLPPNWGGFRIDPTSVEFWQGRRSRLHDRLRYRRETSGDWVVERLGS
ncbi:MAG TPA: pyridoxamine 5'-phosphate oxidase [Candidatus Didemnitutus sp.]|nr:pyridoxamine 5'-phosphate oxidase [Candidatus Didemnitutus sp.]